MDIFLIARIVKEQSSSVITHRDSNTLEETLLYNTGNQRMFTKLSVSGHLSEDRISQGSSKRMNNWFSDKRENNSIFWGTMVDCKDMCKFFGWSISVSDCVANEGFFITILVC